MCILTDEESNHNMILNTPPGEGCRVTQSSVIASLSDALRRDISLGVLKPGDRLNIEGLKRAHKISHPSVREALSLLVGEGFVASEGKKGFRVLDTSLEDLRDKTRVRSELEVLAFGWSVANADTDWRASVVAAHYALGEVEAEMATDPEAFVLEWDERNRNFHLALAANCGSPHLIDLIAHEYDLSRRYRLMAHARDHSDVARVGWIKASAQEHQGLVDAVRGGDASAGQALLRDHITKGKDVAELLEFKKPAQRA